MKTISEALEDYLRTIQLARSENTFLSYRTALNNFLITLSNHKIRPDKDGVSQICEDVIGWFANDLKDYSATTEQLYIIAAKGFLEYLVAEELADINLSKVKLLIRQRTRRPGKRLPQFPADNITRIIDYFERKQFQLPNSPIGLKFLWYALPFPAAGR